MITFIIKHFFLLAGVAAEIQRREEQRREEQRKRMREAYFRGR